MECSSAQRAVNVMLDRSGWTVRLARLNGPTSILAIMLVLLSATSVFASLPETDVLYASNWGPNGSISKIVPGGMMSTFASGLAFPQGLACDASGNLYVALQVAGQIDKITPAGSITTFASGVQTGVADLVFDNAGNLYAASQSGAVEEITRAGVVSTFATGLPAPSAGGPQGLAFDSNGNLFVADYGENEILKIARNGTSSVFATGLNMPVGLAVDQANNLYVGNFGSQTISEFNPLGVSSTFASVPNGVWGLAFDSAGNLFAGSAYSTNISEVQSNGAVSTYAAGLPGSVFYLADPTTSSVPEPTGVAAATVAAALAFGRRRRSFALGKACVRT